MCLAHSHEKPEYETGRDHPKELLAETLVVCREREDSEQEYPDHGRIVPQFGAPCTTGYRFREGRSCLTSSHPF